MSLFEHRVCGVLVCRLAFCTYIFDDMKERVMSAQ
jgi:hypothetical protein